MPQKIDLEALCAEKGLRITDQRRVIARVISDAEDHPDVETLRERASAVEQANGPVDCSRKRAYWTATILAMAAPVTRQFLNHTTIT